LSLLFREVAQQLADAGVGRLLGSRFVEALGLELHCLGLLTYGVQPQRANQPNGPPAHKPFNVVPADQWNVLAEALPVGVEQAMAMTVLFRAHLAELIRLRRVAVLQPFGEVVVNTGVFFLERYRQGEDFLFGEALKRTHGIGPPVSS